MPKICSNCKSVNNDQVKYCIRCGYSNFDQMETTGPNCEFCGKSFPSGRNINFCPSCGKKQSTSKSITKMKQLIAPEGIKHKCGICLQEIDYGFIVCPSCLNPFHFNHISNWVIENGLCPLCRTKLVFEK